ncbi:hypothetical protein SKAU_G00024790 [Synaphobranchus kaupii]|uniref:Uncharacterized protein n=1 Tax=Synaphobranchus kaupii TaxID=118154 RepID=A0A9Q1JCK2_SYNKA|nr:hypothetical protein SKAU_G00024790 [Synaphobranchus kaupii]
MRLLAVSRREIAIGARQAQKGTDVLEVIPTDWAGSGTLRSSVLHSTFTEPAEGENPSGVNRGHSSRGWASEWGFWKVPLRFCIACPHRSRTLARSRTRGSRSVARRVCRDSRRAVRWRDSGHRPISQHALRSGKQADRGLRIMVTDGDTHVCAHELIMNSAGRYIKHRHITNTG